MGNSRTPVVAGGQLHEQGGAPIELHSARWHDWLIRHSRFTFRGAGGHFSARKERRQSGDYWYAYRRRDGRLRKAYLGKSAALTAARLEKAAADLAGDRVHSRFPGQPQALEPAAAPATPVLTSFATQAKIRPSILPPRLVTRIRLTAQLHAPITIISAPGGYGKSTLLNAWRQARAPLPVAWAALDADDDGLLRFWSTVVMALLTILPALGETLLPDLQRQTRLDPAEVGAQVSAALRRQGSPSAGMGLVLDNFHHIKQPDVLASLHSWFDYLPLTLQLLIASRQQPPLALGRLRALGMVTELGQDDLRFTLAEGVDFLRQHLAEPALADSELERLVKRTGGWAAGLKLAALACNKHPDPRHISATFSGAHLYVRDYFLETALQQQPAAVQTFLLQTSILQQLTGALCNAVTGRTDGAQMLAQLWQESMFLSRAEDRSWYRYQDLFAEMLRDQLERQRPRQVAELHRRAAGWYRQQNASADAVHHLLAANDWEEAASIIEAVALRQLVEYGEDSRTLRWLRQLPEAAFRRHRSLLSTYLRLARMALPSAEVEHVLSRLESELANLPLAQLTQEERDVLAELRAMRHGPPDTRPDNSQGDARWQLIDALKVIKPYYLRRSEAEEAQLWALYEQAREQGNLFVVLLAGGDYAHRVYLRGQLRESERIASQVLQHAQTQRGTLPEPASVALYVLCKICLERHDVNQARQLLQQATDVDPNPTSSNMRIALAIARAKLQAALRDHAAARATLRAARALQAEHPSPAWRDADLAAYEALFWLPSGEWGTVERLLGQIGDAAHPLGQRVRAEMWLRQDQPELAESLLRALLQRPIPYEPLMEIRVLLALSLYGQHRLNQALNALNEAIRLALPERELRPFVDHATDLLPLFALRQHTESTASKAQPFIDEILRAAGESADTISDLLPPDTLDLMAVASLITERELEVLRLVRDGYSNQEIGRQLVIADGTVKTHLSNIYRKLDVHSRMQAVVAARTLKLI